MGAIDDETRETDERARRNVTVIRRRERAQVNLSGAYGASVRIPIPSIDLKSLALAWRQESSWQQRVTSVASSALLPSKAQRTKESLQARLKHLDEELFLGGSAESATSDAAAANTKFISFSA
jgi:hypothetical protein